MLKKHAYLIIAHNEYEILKKLIKVLDDERNDIYIHIDKKSKSFKKLKTELVSCYSNIFFTKRINVTWGGDSQIKCELLLLEEAFKIGYEYYHLISGVDFPIKTQDYIHDYFDKYPYNYLCIDGEDIGNEFAQKRIKEYYFFQNLIGRKNINIYKILSNLQIKSIIFQKKFKINRIKKLRFKFYKGSNWFSLRHEAVEYILDNKKFIKKHFKYSFCADGIFLQTLLYNSTLRNKIINDDLRYIDWNRGHPYVFNECDFLELINSKNLFVRKVTEKNKLSNLLVNYLLNNDDKEHEIISEV